MSHCDCLPLCHRGPPLLGTEKGSVVQIKEGRCLSASAPGFWNLIRTPLPPSELAAADDGKPKPPLAKRGSGRRRCRRWRRELPFCVPGSREWFCDFWDHRRSLWLFLPSPENPAGKDGSWGCRRTGSETAAILVQPFLWFESLWFLRKRFGAEVLVAGILIVDFGSRRKGLCDAFELWNLRFEVEELSKNYVLCIGIITYGYWCEILCHW
ncbi:uncharacterized protein DS421_17g588550 [Arachis hypogaea]|nr:uncharacterized protein DS421_17g588550 [Arachis hypogaea]